MSCLSFAHAVRLLIAKADLHGTVTILVRILDLKNTIAARLDDRGIGQAPFLIVEPGHPEFPA
jgi:hypothetical protein